MRDIIDSIIHTIDAARLQRQCVSIAVDGRCAAGKSTLAARLQKAYGCNVIPMDHFFLRPEQRTAKRLSEPGGNVDYERFIEEVLLPLKRREPFSYQPYDCRQQKMADAVRIEPHPITVVEGSYCCHPALFEHYDVRFFLTVDEAEQMRRIKDRNGEADALLFQNTWIPLEERYFSAFNIKERCDFCITLPEKEDRCNV